MRILLVEDEESLQTLLQMNLEAEGYDVSIASDGNEAIELFESESFQLVVLDIMLPKMDGLEVCQRIRLHDQKTPILFLTAKDSAEDRIAGLKLGGDDYLPKPFVLEELLLRVRNLLRRSAPAESSLNNSYTFGPNEINFDTYEANCIIGKVHLTKIEIRLLKMLIDHKNEVVSRKQILHTVWGYEVYPSTRTVDNFIMSFRKYFETDSRNPRYFQSIRGVGYKFVE
jgi:two-component system alkaline phosphatase synthesis response regulator PhoP